MGVSSCTRGGYELGAKKEQRHCDAPESTSIFTLYLACYIAEQTLQHIDALEIVDESRILGFTLLQKFVFVQNSF